MRPGRWYPVHYLIDHPSQLLRVAAALMTAILLGTVIAAPPAVAATETGPGSCDAGVFAADPPPGTGVRQGQRIVYQVDIVVRGAEPVLGCARDVRFSGPVGFVAAYPDGYFSPDTTVGAVATVNFDGPFAPGTKLSGTLVMVVKRRATAADVIIAESLDVIRHR